MPRDVLLFDSTTEPGLLRRKLALALGAGVAVTTSAVAADNPVVETDVTIKAIATRRCSTHQAAEARHGAVIFTDAPRLRPAFRDMGDSSKLRATLFFVPFTAPARHRCSAGYSISASRRIGPNRQSHGSANERTALLTLPISTRFLR